MDYMRIDCIIVTDGKDESRCVIFSPAIPAINDIVNIRGVSYGVISGAYFDFNEPLSNVFQFARIMIKPL